MNEREPELRNEIAAKNLCLVHETDAEVNDPMPMADLSPAEIRSALRRLRLQCAQLLAATGTQSSEPKPKPTHEREIEVCIMEAMPEATAPPISRRKLAPLAGYAYTDHFRRAVTSLIERKLLVESSKGLRKAVGHVCPAEAFGTCG